MLGTAEMLDVADQKLVSRICKELLWISLRKRWTQLKNGQKMDSHFMKEETNMANKYVKIYSVLLITREMQIRTIIRK